MIPLRLVILGGTGFVGGHLLNRLARDGHQLTVLTRNREKHRAIAVIPGVRLKSVDVHDPAQLRAAFEDRKSTRLNSSHMSISYAVFCLKKKKKKKKDHNDK